ncbi:MAG TPA: DUF4867 family protein [Ruminiclostridium sp.]|nr:DUF4867 family protein [Ruminiclostridium sp.]
MTLEQLQESNKHLIIYGTDSEKFKNYGRILTGYNTSEIENYISSSFKVPETGSTYVPRIEGLCEIPVIQELFKDVYGGLEAQAGVCAGKNKVFNGIEFHQGSETVIAVTDCVLFVGKKTDMDGKTFNGELAECFFAKKGQVIEMFDTTLHYSPCNTGDYFITVVILLNGTNTPLKSPSGMISRKKGSDL